jgi:hypothetical protein
MGTKITGKDFSRAELKSTEMTCHSTSNSTRIKYCWMSHSQMTSVKNFIAVEMEDSVKKDYRY